MTIFAPQLQDSTLGQMIYLKTQIDYHLKNIIPFYSEMEFWERKEYEAVYSLNVSDLENKKKYVMEHESIYNELLSASKMSMSVTVFINKFINS